MFSRLSIFSRRPDTKSPWSFLNYIFRKSQNYKCLGVWVDETLSWGTHISEVSGKVAKVLAVLRRLKPLCPGGLSLPQFTNHWVCLILIIVVLSGEILNRAAPTITGTGWDVRSPQILCDYLHDEPRRQENKPIKNITVQNSEQASTRIYIR